MEVRPREDLAVDAGDAAFEGIREDRRGGGVQHARPVHTPRTEQGTEARGREGGGGGVLAPELLRRNYGRLGERIRS